MTIQQKQQRGNPHYDEGSSPFNLDDTTYRQLGQQLIDMSAYYLETLSSRPVYQPMPEEERAFLRQLPLPTQATSPEAVIDFFLEHILPFGRKEIMR
jgi:hypothetical protein